MWLKDSSFGIGFHECAYMCFHELIWQLLALLQVVDNLGFLFVNKVNNNRGLHWVVGCNVFFFVACKVRGKLPNYCNVGFCHY
jgi:hypothetical protein